MKVEVAVLGSPPLAVLDMVSVDVKQHCMIIARAQELCESQSTSEDDFCLKKSETRMTASVLKQDAKNT